MEVSTGLTILGTAVGSAKLIEKILGPTASYLGDGVKEWTEQRVNNVKRIFQIAHKRLGDAIENPGEVPPKVLKRVLDDGSFCDDSLSSEYFGGVLASSRSRLKHDDRGATYLSLISSLSSYQLRAHYIFYRTVQKLYYGKSIQITKSKNIKALTTFIPFDSFNSVMDFDYLNEPVPTLHYHIMFGLAKNNLILDTTYIFGEVDFLRERYPQIRNRGIVLTPTPFGAELFLWALGHGNIPVSSFPCDFIGSSMYNKIPDVQGAICVYEI